MSESLKAVGADLDGIVKQQFAFTVPVKVAKITMAPSAGTGIYGKWNSTDASATDFDFYLAAGESEYSPPFTRISTVTLFSAGALTYETHFSVRGFHRIN